MALTKARLLKHGFTVHGYHWGGNHYILKSFRFLWCNPLHRVTSNKFNPICWCNGLHQFDPCNLFFWVRTNRARHLRSLRHACASSPAEPLQLRSCNTRKRYIKSILGNLNDVMYCIALHQTNSHQFFWCINRERAEYCFESTVLEERTHWILRQTRWVLRETRWVRFGTQIIGRKELTEFAPWNSVSPKKTHWVRCLKPYSPKPYSARFWCM